jgi:hypothetical protein
MTNAIEFVEHQPTHQTRGQRRKADGGGYYEVAVHRFVCTCGHATTWNEDVETSRRLAQRHAIPGQIGLDIR